MPDARRRGKIMKKPKTKRKLSPGEEFLASHLTAYKIPFTREFRFHPVRKWRVDFWIMGTKIVVEIEGSSKGGIGCHQQPKRYRQDMEKYNSLSAMGYTLLRFSTADARRAVAIDAIREMLKVQTND